MINGDTKEQSISIDLNQLLKKSIEGKNLSALFETEIQKKLIEPLFKNISDTISNTPINLSTIDLTAAISKAALDINIDTTVISRLNTSFNDKINNIITSVNGINIEGIKKDFEHNINNQFKTKFDNISVKIPQAVKTKDLLDLVTNNAGVDNLVQYKLLDTTTNLIDKIAAGVKNLSVDSNKTLNITELFDILIQPEKEYNIIAKRKYTDSIGKLLNIIEDGVSNFSIKKEDISSRDIISLIFNPDINTSSYARKKYEQIIDIVSDKLSDLNVPSIDIEAPSTTKNSNIKDNAADYGTKTEDTIFNLKEFSLSRETLKQIKLDNLSNIKEEDLLTNFSQEEKTKRIISSLNELKDIFEDINLLKLQSSNESRDTPSIPPVLPRNKPPSNRRSPTLSNRRSQERTSSRLPNRPRPTTIKPPSSIPTIVQPVRTPTTTSRVRTIATNANRPQRLTVNRVSSTRNTSKPIASAAKLKNIAKTGSVISTVASLGVSGYNYNQINKNVKQNLLTKEEGAIEKSKIIGDAVGGLAGATAGAMAGASIGSIVPVIGTAIGGVIGSLLGGFAGGKIGEKTSEKIATNFLVLDKESQPSAEKLPVFNIPQNIDDKKPIQQIITSPQTFTSPIPTNNTESFNTKEYFDSIIKSDNTLKITATESTKPAESFVEASSTDFTPLISFLDKKFEFLGAGMIVLTQAIAGNANQSPINIINQQEGEQITEQNNYQNNNNSNNFDTIEATRAMFRSL